ncbi:MAG: hypothetical protein WC393_04525 [Candidatus Nanoarchaeia archaeon]|jgi:DNA-binding PadR family transcriptional regulator
MKSIENQFCLYLLKYYSESKSGACPSIAMRELEQKYPNFSRTLSSYVRAISELKDLGLLKSENEDKRKRKYFITEKGKKTYNELKEHEKGIIINCKKNPSISNPAIDNILKYLMSDNKYYEFLSNDFIAELDGSKTYRVERIIKKCIKENDLVTLMKIYIEIDKNKKNNSLEDELD